MKPYNNFAFAFPAAWPRPFRLAFIALTPVTVTLWLALLICGGAIMVIYSLLRAYFEWARDEILNRAENRWQPTLSAGRPRCVAPGGVTVDVLRYEEDGRIAVCLLPPERGGRTVKYLTENLSRRAGSAEQLAR